QARRALHEGAFTDRADRFIAFVAAADALAALDQAGPALGLEISSDGLRRLARLVDPQQRADPIPVTDAVDPELRSLFGFQEPGPDDQAARAPARRAPTAPAPGTSPASAGPAPTSTTGTSTPATETPTTSEPSTTDTPATTDTPPTTAPPAPVSWLPGPRP